MYQVRRINLKGNVWEEDNVHEECIVETGPVLFEIPPNVEHTILNDSGRNIYLMAFSDSDKRDTIRSLLA